MKRIMIVFALIALPFLMGANCKKETTKQKEYCNCADKTKSSSVHKLSGTVTFVESVENWGIVVKEGNTYDNVQIFLPCSLQSTYKVADKKVVFSGETFEPIKNPATPAGTKYLCIKITSIH